MTSSFDEFQVVLKEHALDGITLSEAWLKNSKYLLDYLKDRLLLIKTLYQPNSDPRVLVLWIEKLEEILGTMTKSFGETIILTGDTNIDIKKEH